MRDFTVYLRECWRMAVSIRERQKALIGMIGAFLALPVIWLLGGQPELTSTGLGWFVVWLFLSAFLNAFVLAPFQLWRDQRAALASLSAIKRPRLGSLAFQQLVPGILIEPTGDNRLDIAVVLLNQNSETIRCEGEATVTANGSRVGGVRAKPSFCGAGNVLRITVSLQNVPLAPVNAMVSTVNVSVTYNIRYALADYPDAQPRSTGKTIVFRAPMHMTGRAATTEVLPNFIDETET